MPFVHRCVKLHTRISGSPGAIADVVPELFCGNSFHDFTRSAATQSPLPAFLQRRKKLVRNAYGVIAVLAGNRDICFGLIMRIKLPQRQIIALLRQRDGADNIIERNVLPGRFANGLLHFLVRKRVLFSFHSLHELCQLFLQHSTSCH